MGAGEKCYEKESTILAKMITALVVGLALAAAACNIYTLWGSKQKMMKALPSP